MARQAVFIDHESFAASAWSGMHPLAFSRQAKVRALAEMMGWLESDEILTAHLPERRVLERFHAPAYIDALAEAIEAGRVSPQQRETYGFGTMENPIFPGLFTRAMATVGGSIAAARAALEGAVAFHPAGGTHHGKPNRASGFCYFNDPAFAIAELLDSGVGPVLYLDIDAHHGDGVELLFAGHPQVTTLSIHEEGRWPHSGQPGGAAPPNACNVAVPRGFNDSEMDWLMEGPASDIVARVRPRAVVVTAGADCLAGDPLSGEELSNRAFWRAVQTAQGWADHVVVLGGGGYNPWTVTRGWAGLWAVLSGRDPGASPSEEARAMLAEFESDLVDSDEIDPQWLDSVADAPNPGPVRELVKDRASEALRRFVKG